MFSKSVMLTALISLCFAFTIVAGPAAYAKIYGKSPKKTFNELRKKFRKADTEEERLEYLGHIARIEYEGVRKFLLEVAIEDESIELRKAALDKYGFIDDPKLAAYILSRSVNAGSPSERKYYQLTCRKLPGELMEQVIAWLEDYMVGKDPLSKGYVHIVGGQTWLSEEMAYYRKFAAAETLARISRLETFELLLEYLDHKKWDTRAAAARGLGLVRYAPALNKLEESFYREKNSDARIEYIVAIGRISTEACLKPLERMKKKTEKDPERTFIREAISIVEKNKDKKGKLIAQPNGYAEYERVPDAELVDFTFGDECYFIIDTTLSMAAAAPYIKAEARDSIGRLRVKDRVAILLFRDINNQYLFHEIIITYDKNAAEEFVDKIVFTGSNRSRSPLNLAVKVVGLMPGFRPARKTVMIYGDTPPTNYSRLLQEIRLMRDNEDWVFHAVNCSPMIGGGQAIKHLKKIAEIGGGTHRTLEDLANEWQDEVERGRRRPFGR